MEMMTLARAKGNNQPPTATMIVRVKQRPKEETNMAHDAAQYPTTSDQDLNDSQMADIWTKDSTSSAT